MKKFAFLLSALCVGLFFSSSAQAYHQNDNNNDTYNVNVYVDGQKGHGRYDNKNYNRYNTNNTYQTGAHNHIYRQNNTPYVAHVSGYGSQPRYNYNNNYNYNNTYRNTTPSVRYNSYGTQYNTDNFYQTYGSKYSNEYHTYKQYGNNYNRPYTTHKVTTNPTHRYTPTRTQYNTRSSCSNSW